MNRKKCIEIIEYECIAMKGFLVKLRALEFSQENYESLRDALRHYREFVQGEDKIERSIAYCLHFLSLGLITATKDFSRTEDERSLVHRINAEMSALIDEILIPDNMIGPLPSKYSEF